VNDISDAEKAAAVLHQKGANQVLITLGERGSVFIAKGAKPVHIPAEKVSKVTDTTGAGDCCILCNLCDLYNLKDIGSLAFYLANGKSMEEAMLRATQICAIKVQGYGTQSSYPWMKDLPQQFQI
jgi:ribokinase